MSRLTRACGILIAWVCVVALVGLWGCEGTFPPADGNSGNNLNNGSTDNNDSTEPVYNNTTDRTNKGAGYIGSAACMACHPGVAALHLVHGHAHKLTPIVDGAPVFPAAASRAGVPAPPEGKLWSHVAYVIGGYIRKARFVDRDGYVMTDGVEGVKTQWNLDFPANGTTAKWVSYEADRAADDPKPYDYSCFVCHTTGAREQDPVNPTFQDNRAGMAGTFAEPGVQCEQCHGPGSNHIPNPAARELFVDLQGTTCNECHSRPYKSEDGVIRAKGGFIQHHEQWPELAGSGGHAEFSCLECHEPHTSTNYERPKAIRMTCQECHAAQNMAIHTGKVFVRGDYSEVLGCESCHMPFATKSAGAAASPEVVGDVGRMGDTRTHIFRVNTQPVDYTGMFTADLKEVQKDAQGRAAVTVDFVCLRCHNGVGSAFQLTVPAASVIASGMHGFTP